MRNQKRADKENIERQESIMKWSKKKRAKDEILVQTEVEPVREPKNWVVNCPKCGAALNLKEGGTAYLCPVCNTVLRVKSGVRLVKDVSKEDKTLHVSVTEQAVQYLLEKEKARAAMEKKRCRCKRKKARKAAELLESKLAVSILGGYTKEENVVVDIDETGNLSVKKA